jgi:hypothetical protein
VLSNAPVRTHPLPFQPHPPCGWDQQAAKHAEKRAFPAPRGTDHGYEFAFSQGQIDLLKG